MSEQSVPTIPYPTPLEQGQRALAEDAFAAAHGANEVAAAAPSAAMRQGEDSIARAYDLVAGLEQYAGPAMAAPIRLAVDALAADCREASWTSDRRYEELQRLRRDLRQATITVARMHEAAVGSARPVITGEVEDVARLRAALQQIVDLLAASAINIAADDLLARLEQEASSALYPTPDVDTAAETGPAPAANAGPDATPQAAPPAGPTRIVIDWDKIGRDLLRTMPAQAARR